MILAFCVRCGIIQNVLKMIVRSFENNEAVHVFSHGQTLADRMKPGPSFQLLKMVRVCGTSLPAVPTNTA
jgi:hypothetical protein